jgi:hypothetical protein
MKNLILLIIILGITSTVLAQEKIETESGPKSDFIYKNGYIGIGTTNPTSQLNIGTSTTNSPSTVAQFGKSVASGEARVLSLVNSGGGSNQSASLDFHNGGGWSPTGKIQVQQLGTDTKSKLNFFTYNNGLKNRMTINENGYVGIGTTTPSERLEVNGLIRIRQATNEDNNSPGITTVSNDDFLYDSQYINQYGFGFHGYNDGTTTYTEPRNAYMSGHFGVDFFTGAKNRMRISRNGEVTIGTVNRQLGYILAVNGNIKAKEIKVETDWSDFVFKTNYKLSTLKEVEKHIKVKGHLKDIPSTKEVKENGILLGEMDAKLLQKIEELTLYTIDQEKRIDNLEETNKRLIKLIEKLVKE